MHLDLFDQLCRLRNAVASAANRTTDPGERMYLTVCYLSVCRTIRDFRGAEEHLRQSPKSAA